MAQGRTSSWCGSVGERLRDLLSTSLSPLFLAHYGLDTPQSNWLKSLQSTINCFVLLCLPLYSLMFPYVPLLFSEIYRGFSRSPGLSTLRGQCRRCAFSVGMTFSP